MIYLKASINGQGEKVYKVAGEVNVETKLKALQDTRNQLLTQITSIDTEISELEALKDNA